MMNTPQQLPAVALCGLTVLLTSAPGFAQIGDASVLRGHTDCVYALAYAPDGSVLVSGSADHSLRFWQCRDNPDNPLLIEQRKRLLRQLDSNQFAERQEASWQLALLADTVKTDLLELTKSPSAEVRVRARHLLQILQIPPGIGHTGDVRCLAISPNGEWVVSGSRDNTVRVWRTATARSSVVAEAHHDGVWSVAISPDGQLLATGGGDQQVKLWNLKRMSLVAQLPGHDSTIHDLVFSPDGATLVSAGGFDRTVKVWDIPSSQLRQTLQGHTDAVLTVALSPAGTVLLSAGYDGDLLVWNMVSGELSQKITIGSVVRDIEFSPDGQQWSVATDDGAIYLWTDPSNAPQMLTHRGNAVFAVAFSPSGDTLAAAGRDGQIKCWPLRASDTGPSVPTPKELQASHENPD